MPVHPNGAHSEERRRNVFRTLRRGFHIVAGTGLIARSGLFLPEWYNLQNDDVRSQGGDPLSHYCAYGAYEGRDPNPLFDNEWYRDLYLAGREDTNPLVHFLKSGHRQGLRPHPMFDPAWYAMNSPDRLSTPAEALRHFLTRGVSIGLSPDPRWPSGSHAEEFDGGEVPVYVSRLADLTADAGPWTQLEVRRALGLTPRGASLSDKDESVGARPLVSVIMPVFNRRSIVGEAIRSVLDQSYRNFEFIICDDGSSDDSVQAIETLTRSDHRTLVLRNTSNEGAAAARNACLQRASGEYIAYLDSDNIWHPAYLSLMIAELDAHADCDVAYASYFDIVTDGATRHARPTRYRDFRFDLQVRNPYIDLNSLVHRSRSYETFGGFDPRLRMLQDYELIMRYASPGRVLHLPIALNIYRRIPSIGQLSEGNRTEALRIIAQKHRSATS